MDKKTLIRRIKVASGTEPADVIIKNGRIIDVFNSEIFQDTIAIVDGYIAGIGNYKGKKVIDAKGRYISPGFIDGHVHIESTMITPKEFARLQLQHGVTSVIADPHEIANVLGEEGLHYMLNASANLPFDIFFMLPSSVPATDFERSGANLTIKELSPFLNHFEVLGLGEVMDFPSLKNTNNTIIDKIIAIKRNKGKIDGHAAGLKANDLNILMSAGIRSDHECISTSEAVDRLRRGIYLMIREGTVAKDLKSLIKAVNVHNARRCLFVTDDKHLDDIIDKGSIDHNIRLAIKEGLTPLTAFQMATINAAECFGLENHGAIAPGYQADLILLDNLESVKIIDVFKKGNLVVQNGKIIDFLHPIDQESLYKVRNSIHSQDIKEEDLRIPIKNHKANVIGVKGNSLITNHLIENVDTDDNNFFLTSIEKDLIKLVVIERHHYTNSVGLGIVKGLGLKAGAIGSTIAHDSHNLILAGVSDSDIKAAADRLKEMRGGLILIKDGMTIMSLPLPIAGLMSTEPYEKVYSNLQLLNQALNKVGINKGFNPFLTLSFLSLPVIPELKLTAQGLYDVVNQKNIKPSYKGTDFV